MTGKAAFIFSEDLLKYKFKQNHPFNQLRLKLTKELLEIGGFLDDSQIIPPRYATKEELLYNHDERFIEAVKKASVGLLDEDIAENFGLGTEDTPIFSDMHNASSLVVGGSIEASEYVMSGQGKHALHLGGGLHHSQRGKASGFCVYNDCSVAIHYIRKKYNARVLYVDTDAHHGDGVQWSFYDDPNVCTFSIHETGRYLFPGTGQVYERGTGPGYGCSFNIPLDAFTEDESWLFAYHEAFEKIVQHFKPDVILTQNGADAHYFDPLTHLSTTMKIYREIPKMAHRLAHQYCDGRWIAVGGGGYDIWRVVPRVWSLIWIEMSDQGEANGELPKAWIDKWQKNSPVELPKYWDDLDQIYPAIPRKPEIEEKNKITVQKSLQILTGHAN